MHMKTISAQAQSRKPGKQSKVVSASEAVSVVENGDMIATGGFVGNGFAEHLAIALENRFVETGEPREGVRI